MRQEKRLEILQRLIDKNHKHDSGDVSTSFGDKLVFDLSMGEFPLATTNYVDMNNAISELDWFIKGSSNIGSLVERGCNSWNDKVTPLVNVGSSEKFELRPIEMVDFSRLKEKYHYPTLPGLVDRPPSSLDEMEISSHYARYRATANVVDAPEWLKDLWYQLLNQSYAYYFGNTFDTSKAMEVGRIRGMVPAWFIFSTFLDDIKKCCNYDVTAVKFTSTSEYTCRRKYILTAIWSNASIVGPETADFLHIDELTEYANMYDTGILKVYFKDMPHGKVCPMYVMNDDQVTERIDQSLEIDKVERVSVGVSDDKHLRYAKTNGWVNQGSGSHWRECIGPVDSKVDQLHNVISLLKDNPQNKPIILDARGSKHTVTSMLPSFQVYAEPLLSNEDGFNSRAAITEYEVIDVEPIKRLSLQVNIFRQNIINEQPHNVAVYATLLLKLCAEVNALPGKLIIVSGETYLQKEDEEQATRQLVSKVYLPPLFKIGEWGDGKLLQSDIYIKDYNYRV